MLFSVMFMFVLFFLKFDSNLSMAQEPMCSKFSCEEQLLEKMIRQELKVEKMQNDIKKTQEAVSETLVEIQKTSVNVSKTLKELKNENMKTPSVAFFAHNVLDLKLDKTDKIIVFTTTTTNEGSGYDIFTGIFTAPIGGLYQFIVNYCTYYQQHSLLALVMSDNVIARSSNYDSSTHTCTSFSAIVKVESGEKIWVKCLEGISSRALNKNSSMMNSFNGFLINK